jgi:DNA repair exonuclease SbcCD ATPase subunit
METVINNDKNELQQEINELKQKYDTLLKDIKCLEDNKNNIKDIAENSYGVVQNVSKNIENVMNELNNLKKEYENTTSSNMITKDKMKFSIKKIFVNPLRKIAVGTIQSAFLIVDKTVEGMSNAKEGIEDIVAEAQYQNKKKNIKSTQI